MAVFEGLYRIVKNVPNPAECTSVERCIFFHLYDLFKSATPVLKALTVGYESFTNAIKVYQSIYSSVTVAASNHGQWNTTFMAEAIANYRRGGKGL